MGNSSSCPVSPWVCNDFTGCDPGTIRCNTSQTLSKNRNKCMASKCVCEGKVQGPTDETLCFHDVSDCPRVFEAYSGNCHTGDYVVCPDHNNAVDVPYGKTEICHGNTLCSDGSACPSSTIDFALNNGTYPLSFCTKDYPQPVVNFCEDLPADPLPQAPDWPYDYCVSTEASEDFGGDTPFIDKADACDEQFYHNINSKYGSYLDPATLSLEERKTLCSTGPYNFCFYSDYYNMCTFLYMY